MGCFPCTGGGNSSINRPEKKRKDLCDTNGDHHYRRHDDRGESREVISNSSGDNEDASYINRSAAAEEDNASSEDSTNEGANYSRCRRFRFAELESATENFRLKNFLGEGGFGKVYKGCLVDTGEVVAIKQLDRNGCQGSREFQVEVQFLSYADHPNLVKLIGCCDEGDQKVLVYEYMPLGSLEDHLHGPPSKRKQLDWNNRMKIAAGAARGLEYLHDRMDPPIVYRDLKCANILLGEGYHPKLSDFGLARTGPSGPETHVSTRVMGTYGYCAPEYALTGQLTLKSDIYSFGVFLLEIITGRKAIDNTASPSEQNLVNWAKPLFKDRKKFRVMADPLLEGQYPVRGLYQAIAISAMCVNEKALMRPIITDVVAALDYLASQTYDPNACPSRISRRSSSSHQH